MSASMRKITKDLQVSRRTIGRVAKEALGLTPYKIRRRHFVSEPSKTKRFNRAKKMLEEMRSTGDKAFLWTDEKIFTVEP